MRITELPLNAETVYRALRAQHAFAPDDQVALGLNDSGGRRHRAPSISLRATISRMISLVPSSI